MRMELERRIAGLSAQIRGYPTPIARCDEQLAALLDERSRLITRLADHENCAPLAQWTNDGGCNAA